MRWRLPLRGRGQDDDPVVALDRWQLTQALLGLGVIVVAVFFAGVFVGRKTQSSLPAEVARVVAPAGAAATETKPKERLLALAGVPIGTQGIDSDLARPLGDVVPNDPTDAARIETHRQIQASREHGVASLGAGAGLEGATAEIAPAADAGSAEGGYTLQVSAFDSQDAASAVVKALDASGHHDARARQVSAAGRVFWRVEIGKFASMAQATAFQRRFESDAGYSTVLIPM
ncbi:MAG: SPOR domain-containing protein [Myxococcales bacterium]|nr:SPOR domain-containing protein [Myxococcales bacterium]MCB9733455.1 SPOR domain-containing protein [Deltaproteobacteria bacterium]